MLTILCICGGALEVLLLVSGIGALVHLVRRLVRRLRSRTVVGVDYGTDGYESRVKARVDPDGTFTVLECECKKCGAHTDEDCDGGLHG